MLSTNFSVFMCARKEACQWEFCAQSKSYYHQLGILVFIVWNFSGWINIKVSAYHQNLCGVVPVPCDGGVAVRVVGFMCMWFGLDVVLCDCAEPLSLLL